MKILHKTLVKKWFQMIESGEKLEEYLEIKPFWNARLLNVDKPLDIPVLQINYNKLDNMFWFSVGYKKTRSEALKFLFEQGAISFKNFDIVSANNGYQKNCPNIKWEHKGIRIGEGREEWGAAPGKQYFILSIGEIIRQKPTCHICGGEDGTHTPDCTSYVHGIYNINSI